MATDTLQIAQTVQWLDEEHRRDRNEIAKLNQRLETQSAEIIEQARRIQELEGRLASTQSQLIKFTQIEQALAQLKSEVVLMLQRMEEQHSGSVREAERMRHSDREAVSRGISEIRKELPRIPRLEEQLSTFRVEDQRLSEIVLALRQQQTILSKDIDERTRSIPYLAEQRQQDNKRIAQLQQETVELFKRTETTAGKIDVVQQAQFRLEKELQIVQPIPGEMKRAMDTFIEAQKLQDAQRDRVVQETIEVIEQFRGQIDQNTKRVASYAEGWDESKRAVATVARFQESVRRDVSQIVELQRLSEERQKREFAEYEAENEKRWKKQLLDWDRRWQDQAKINVELAEKWPPLVTELQHHEILINQLWKIHEAEGSIRLAETQRWLDELSKHLEGRAKRPGENGRSKPRQEAK